MPPERMCPRVQPPAILAPKIRLKPPTKAQAIRLIGEGPLTNEYDNKFNLPLYYTNQD